MAEAMIGVALETISSLIQKELVSFLGVDAEITRLSSVLSTIKAVLENAEEKQLSDDKALKNWLRKLRDSAHVLDDILDEISTHALSLEYQHKVQGSWLYSLNPTHVKFRYKIGKKLKDIGQTLDEIAEARSRFHLREIVHERRNQVIKWRETSSIITQPQFYGREAEKQKIVDFLVGEASNSEEVSVYPIIGMGGLGKTTLAQQVFNDERVVSHFELRIWVCVSDDLDLKRLSKAIIDQSHGHACGDLDLESLQRRVQEVVGTKRYLIVLDDVWNDDQEKWNKLKFVLACGSKGASILVTTRLATVARITRTETVTPLQLSLLSEDDCWELFRQRALGSEEEECEELVSIGKEIVKKCKGVPLAAKTLGSLLCFQRDEKEWLRVKESEIWSLPQEEDSHSIMPALKLSYLNLPTKFRQCFGYLAVFPKDEKMSKRLVIELWMANGFISTSEGCEVEEDGGRVWNELYLRSFFEDVEIDESKNDTWFKMHDLVHDLAQFVMEGECYSIPFKNGPPGERTHHLSFYKSRFPKQWSSHLYKIKSLKTFIRPHPYYNADNCDVFMKCYTLRALDVKYLKEVSPSIDQLKHLRYLNLCHGTFTTLPNSICRLWNLQILNLNDCERLQKLPNQMKDLKSLRHLHLKNCWSLLRLAPEMGQLTCLKTLKTYIVGRQKGFLFEEVGNMKLEGTLHIKHLERVTSVMDAKRANLPLKRLDELELSWERNEESQLEENEEKILEVLEPDRQLKTLVIRGYLGTQLPQWMVNLTIQRLSCLKLEGCKNLVCISFLVKLACLKRLWLSNMNHVEYIDEECYGDGAERGFQALEELRLESLPRLVKLAREEGENMFPRLSKFQIAHCSQLNMPFLPSVIELEVGEKWNRLLHGSFQKMPNLERLCFHDDEVTSFPNGMLGGLNYLKQLRIGWLPNLEVLPSGLSNLNALQHLSIEGCISLETITEEALHGLSSLKTFRIWGCSVFKLSAGFRHLVALEDLTIELCEEVEDLHDTLQHIVTLRILRLECLPNLTSLPDWLGNLKSLESLKICKCPKVKSLPMSTQSLSNLKSLSIFFCPELAKRCKEETGEDWHKIAHVPHRLILG